MKQHIKTVGRTLFRHLGLDVRRITSLSSEDAKLVLMLTRHGINLVLDVGANAGQFGTMIRGAGYTGRLVSFEPLSNARSALLAASANDPKWIIAPQSAIGDTEGSIKINIAGNSASSSVLDMLEAHVSAAPHTAYVAQELVPIRRLDDAANDYVASDSVLFIKIDTQGYEDRVLNGAKKMLAKAKGIQLELSFLPLYKSQLLYDQMLPDLTSAGFELWDLSPVFVDPTSGRLMQADATFFRQ